MIMSPCALAPSSVCPPYINCPLWLVPKITTSPELVDPLKRHIYHRFRQVLARLLYRKNPLDLVN